MKDYAGQGITISKTEGKRDTATISGPSTLSLQREYIIATHTSLDKPSHTVQLQLVVGKENSSIRRAIKITWSWLIMEGVGFYCCWFLLLLLFFIGKGKTYGNTYAIKYKTSTLQTRASQHFSFLNKHVKIEICQEITFFTYCPYIKNLDFKYFQKHGVLCCFVFFLISRIFKFFQHQIVFFSYI